MSAVKKSRALATLLCAAAVLTSLSVTTTLPATAAEPAPVTAFVLFDRTQPNPSFSSNRFGAAVRATSTGGVLTYEDIASIAPPVGGRLVPGRISLTPGGAVGEPTVRLGGFCATTYDAFVSGYLDVREATYADDGTLTSLAADVSLDCGWTVQTAEVRLASTVPYASVAADGNYATVYPGGTGTVTTTFTNNGTLAYTPGAPYLTGAQNGTAAPDPAAVISGDSCSGNPVVPGGSCSVTVNTPNSVTVQLPVPALDDLVTRPGMRPAAARTNGISVADRPTPVGPVTATPAVDGVYVRWTLPSGPNQSYRVERLAPDGTATVLSNSSDYRYADTDAPTDHPSSYRISPVGRAGADVTGSKTSAAVTPVTGWATPAGAVTYMSVDGSAPIQSNELALSESGLQAYASTEHPGVYLSAPGGWQLGRRVVGDGTVTVTRLALRADGRPAELAAVYTGTRTDGGRTVPVTALAVISSTPAGLPGYLASEFPTQSSVPPAATISGHTLHTKVTPGTVFDFPVTLRNLGGAPVTPTTSSSESIFVTPARGTNWSGTSTCMGEAIAPGGTCRTAVRYDDSRGQYFHGRTTWMQSDGQTTQVDLFADAQNRQNLPTVSMQTSGTVVQHDVDATASGTDPSGGPVHLWCRLDLEPVTACPATWAVRGLSDGMHTLRAFATTDDGRMSDWTSQQVRADNTGPVTSLTQPTTGFGVVTSSRVHLAWDASDQGFGVVGSQARHRTASPTTGLSSAAVASCCVGLSGRSVDVPATPGAEQCWSVRSVDGAGQYGEWTGERCFLAPLDDRKLASRGFTRATSTAAFLGTRSVTRRKGATLTLAKVRTRQVGLVVSTCRTCGSAQVLLGGRSIGTVRTAASRTANRVVVWLPRLTSERVGTLTVRSTGTRPVTVDGLLVHHF